MARTRSVKPDDFLDDVLGAEGFPVEAHFLRVGLNCLADKEGRLEDRPQKIAAQIFPYRHSLNVAQLLARLEHVGSIRRYTVAGQRYIQLVGFSESQNPHPNEAKSRLPGPELHDGGTATPAHVITGTIQEAREDSPSRHLISDPCSLASDPGSLISSSPPGGSGVGKGDSVARVTQPPLLTVVASGPTPEDLQALWNRLAVPKGLARWESLSKARRRAAQLALDACSDLGRWEAWLSSELKNPWNLGENPNRWRADVEWFLRVKTRDKVADFDPLAPPRRPQGAQHGVYGPPGSVDTSGFSAEDIQGGGGA